MSTRTIDDLERTLRSVLVQYERAMHELTAIGRLRPAGLLARFDCETCGAYLTIQVAEFSRG